jgi:glutathione S-transferase
MRLYTFQISHFSEKARFALDLSGISYEEKRLLPGAHIVTTRRLAKKSSVPILVDGKNIVQGSCAILDRLESHLGYGALAVAPENRARADELEALADRAFGRGTQTIFYEKLLDSPDLVISMWTQRGPRWGRAFYKVMLRFIAPQIRKKYRVNAKDVAIARDTYTSAFDEMDRALGGEKYFFGGKLSRVDITVAALLAPLVQPNEHPFEWPKEEPPPELSSLRKLLERRPTWNHVARIYAEHRRAR